MHTLVTITLQTRCKARQDDYGNKHCVKRLSTQADDPAI